MTVPSSTSTVPYITDGISTIYPIPFRFLEDSHILVTTRTGTGPEVVEVGTYTVAGAGNPSGGTVTFSPVKPAGITVVISRNVPLTQEADYVDNDPFPAESHEDALDKLTMIAQQLKEQSDRSLRLPITAGAVSTELPQPVASNLLGWDASLSGMRNFTPAEIATAVAFSNWRYDRFTASPSQTAFTLAADPGALGNLDVSIDGVTQVPIDDYTLSGTTLTLTSAMTGGERVLARYGTAAGATDANVMTWQPAGAGAVQRTVQGRLLETVSVIDFGAVGDGVANDRGAFALVAADTLATGGRVEIPAGAYSVGQAGLPGIEIDSPITGEPDVDRRSVSLRGHGAGNTVIRSSVAAQYAIKLTGGTGVDAHGYENHADFSIVAGVAGANGMHLFNKAYTSLDGMTIQGCGTGLLLESVLSSTFRNLTLGNNSVYGARALKGAGFSGVNSVTFDSCNFRSNVVLGFESASFITDATFVSCNFENNGRQGQAAEGGCRLTFDGSEGRTGATFVGGYFESNAGGADLFLTNTGAEYVTVTLIGVTFNRNQASRFVTNCIQTAGKIRLVLIGCAFASYNGYTPSAGRPYIAGDASLIFEHQGCQYQDAVEAPTALQIATRLPQSGSVSSAGAALRLPAGWSCSRIGAGNYRVTHNLGLTTNDYAVTATTSNGGTSFVLAVTKGINVFDVATVNPSFASTDAQFDFVLARM